MTYISKISNIARSEGDPKVVRLGPSPLGLSDRLAKGLGWFSIILGAAELIAPDRITKALGMEGKERLVRAYGAREIVSGIFSLSIDKQTGLWSRLAGDGLDIATLMTGLRPDNPKRDNVVFALAMVGGVTLLDAIGAQSTGARHSLQQGKPRRYGDRSGFPNGVQAAKGAAKNFQVPSDMRSGLSLVPSARQTVR
jgi:hypothetical protein